MINAARVAWELTRGEIPPGEGSHGTCVLHRCDNRRYVNPAHLFLGSNLDNMRDMDAKGRRHLHFGEHNGKTHLTAEQVMEIRGHQDISGAEFARRFNMSVGGISQIRLVKTWKHVPVSIPISALSTTVK
jgi:hypothetical protein